VKIPPNQPRSIGLPAGPEAPQRTAASAAPPQSDKTTAAIVQPGPSWSKAALDDPAAAAKMFSEALGQIIDASPTASQLRPAQRQQLERLLSADPAMQDLVTRSMERALK